MPLVNYKNGRFCEDHLGMAEICGIIPCGEPVTANHGVTCDRNTHQEWYSKYSQRFSRLSYPGVRRVIRRQQNSTPGAAPFTLNIEQQLPDLDDIPGNEVSHTFRARSGQYTVYRPFNGLVEYQSAGESVTTRKAHHKSSPSCPAYGKITKTSDPVL